MIVIFDAQTFIQCFTTLCILLVLLQMLKRISYYDPEEYFTLTILYSSLMMYFSSLDFNIRMSSIGSQFTLLYKFFQFVFGDSSLVELLIVLESNFIISIINILIIIMIKCLIGSRNEHIFIPYYVLGVYGVIYIIALLIK